VHITSANSRVMSGLSYSQHKKQTRCVVCVCVCRVVVVAMSMEEIVDHTEQRSGVCVLGEGVFTLTDAFAPGATTPLPPESTSK
jgi:hypothetical protein